MWSAGRFTRTLDTGRIFRRFLVRRDVIEDAFITALAAEPGLDFHAFIWSRPDLFYQLPPDTSAPTSRQAGDQADDGPRQDGLVLSASRGHLKKAG